jgi:hypothetical protein
MTKLPATFVEAEALAFARDWIAGHREPNGVFHPDANVIYGTAAMKRFAQFHPFNADDILYFAEHGSKEADLALRELIAERIDRGEPLGGLAGYNIRSLNLGKREKKSGPGKGDNFVRDIGIFLLVEALVRQFPTLGVHKNPKANQPTTTTIAAAALTEAGIGISFGPKGVGKVWDRYKPIWTGNFPSGFLGPLG